MKYLILILIPLLSFSQQDVPEEYWITDNEFEKQLTLMKLLVMITLNL